MISVSLGFFSLNPPYFSIVELHIFTKPCFQSCGFWNNLFQSYSEGMDSCLALEIQVTVTAVVSVHPLQLVLGAVEF